MHSPTKRRVKACPQVKDAPSLADTIEQARNADLLRYGTSFPGKIGARNLLKPERHSADGVCAGRPSNGVVQSKEQPLHTNVKWFRSGSEAGSYSRLIDSCIAQLKAQGPSGTCNESQEEKEEAVERRARRAKPRRE